MIRIRPWAALCFVLVGLAGCSGSNPQPTTSASISVSGSFRAIRAADGFQVSVAKGPTPGVVVSSTGIGQDQVLATVEDGVLTLETVSGTVPTGASLSADVTVSTLESVTATAGATVRAAPDVPISGDDGKLSLSAGASFQGAVSATRLTADLHAGATSDLSGAVRRGRFSVVEASKLTGADLTVTDATVEMSSGASALISVKRTLSVSLSSGASLTYRGNPQLGRKQVTGGASLRKASS